jgi:hypothetical protein
MMMLMNIVAIASIYDEEKTKPTRERKRRRSRKKSPEPPYIAFSFFLIPFSRLLLLLFFLTFCMTKKTQLASDSRPQ